MRKIWPFLTVEMKGGQEPRNVGSLEARKARKQILLLSSPRKSDLVDTLVFSQFDGFVLNFWPPELLVNTVLLLQGNKLVTIYHSNCRKLITI